MLPPVLVKLLASLGPVAHVQYHLGQLKAKLAKLRTQLQEGNSKARPSCNTHPCLFCRLAGGC